MTQSYKEHMQQNDNSSYTSVMGKDNHESKPIRAAVASGLSSISNAFFGITGLATAGMTTLNPFSNKTFTENLQDSSLIKTGTAISDKIHETIGANKPQDQDKVERLSSFIGDLIPTIATAGSYGLVKVPTSVAAKVSSKLGGKYITKKTVKSFKDNAKTKLSEQGLSKKDRLNILKEAKLNARDRVFNPLVTARELTLPGIQIPRTDRLVRNNIIRGMSYKDAMNKAHRTQLLSGGLQAGIGVGAYEGIAAYTDNEGLIGDYRDEPETFEVEQQFNEAESNNVIPALLFGLGGYIGYKQASKLLKNDIKNVVSDNERLNTLSDTARQWAPNEKVNDTIASSFSDKTTIMDNPEFNYLFPDEDIKGLIRADRQTEIQNMYDTGNVGHGVENSIPFRQVEQDLLSLQQNDTEAYSNLENLLRLDNEIQNIIHQQNIDLYTNPKTPNDYSLFKNNDYYLHKQAIPQTLDSLYKERTVLYDTLIKNPRFKQLLDNISQTDKVLLDLQHKAGILNDVEYKYNLQNRTIDGFFSYKPRIAASTDQGIVKNSLNKINDFIFDKDYSMQLKQSLRARTKYRPEVDTLSYLDTYVSKVKNILNDITENSIKRTTLPRILAIQEKKIFERFEELLPIRLKFTDKKRKALNDLVREADKSTRIRYLGSRDIRQNAQIVPSNTVFSYLNKPIKTDSLFRSEYFKEQGNYADAGYITNLVENGLNKERNTKVVSFFTEDGTEHFFEVHKLIGNMLDFSPETLGFMQNVFRGSKRVMQSFTTGNLNPFFAPVSATYAAFEGLTALPVILAKNGLDYNMLKDSYGLIRSTIKAAKMRYTNETTQNIIDNWRSAWLVNDVDNPLIKQYNEAQIIEMEANLKNTFLSKAQQAGAVTYHYSNDLSDRTFKININKTFGDKFLQLIRKRFGSKASQVMKMLGVMQECLRNAGNDGMLLYIAGKTNAQNHIDLRKIADSISKNITDSKRVGNYSGFLGAFIGGVARYVPYGNVMIQSISAKLHAANAKAGYEFLRTAVKQVKKSDKKVIDTFAQIQLGAQAIKDNKFVHGLVATAGIPAVICYLWNHATDNNRKEYYTLSDYDKSSKYILANFWGEGKHLSIPVDQEVSFIAKLVETMLDSIFLGSKMQDVDPAFEQHRLIMQALSRSLNIENLIYPEIILNASGYQSEFGASNLSGSSLIKPLPPNQTNLDGSKTAIQNGIFSQEARAVVNTMFGALGNALLNGVEQGNIGTRDVGMVQGTADFLSGMIRPLTKNLPLVPMDNKFTIRSANQTQQQNKLKQNTIFSLRKLRTFVENNNNDKFGRRKNGKVTNMAEIKPLTPDLQYALQIANVAVPEYNKQIAPIFDEISATYKQIAAYNATGRDRFGNIVDSSDRFTFQQKQNEYIQELHSKIYNEFKNLENKLTITFGHDITLDDFDKLKGE